ncbi:MAG: glutamine--fructose-6-phosphate transaminase (isomerizing) [Candidatus Aenigmatarchaeota archaeon]
MCGIVGYIGHREIVPLIISSLKKMEYRGYDSAGLCVLNNKNLQIMKKSGKISQLENIAALADLNGTIGIGHTRWATHGIPNDNNAHPHTDCKGSIAVVHNGIIENFQSLKYMLESEGHKFKTDTDTEVIAHMIEKFYVNDTPLEKAVSEALNIIVGTYGIAVVSDREEKIVAARNGSPLVLGIGDDECFVASDAMAFMNYTKNVVYLHDSDIATITKSGYKINGINGAMMERKIDKILWNAASIEKGGFEHFMLKEIFEQPESVRNAMTGRMDIKNLQVKITLDVPDEFLCNIRRIVITACGTSWHAALVGKYLIERYCNIPTDVDYASEFRYRSPAIDEDTLVIAISQSGETADTLHAVRHAKKKGSKVIGIVNVVGSTISREVDGGIYIHAGPEIGVASTKAFVCQVVCLNLLSVYLARLLGKMDNETTKSIFAEMQKIPDFIEEALKENENIKDVSAFFSRHNNCLFLGRGFNFPVALEGALKMKELSYIHAEGYPAAEMKHGPIALIDNNMPVVFIINRNDPIREKIMSNIQEVKARGGKIVAIANKGDEEIKKYADFIINVPETIDILSPVINVIPLQLLGYHTAVARGCDVDKPRNLAKSVTVE